MTPQTTHSSTEPEVERKIVTAGMTGSGPVTHLLSKAGVLPTPAVDLEPIVVIEKKDSGSEGIVRAEGETKTQGESEFVREAKSGNRRLV